MRTVAAIAALCMAACGASPVAPQLSFRLVGHGGAPSELRTGEPAVVVIRDAGEWSAFTQKSGLRAPSGNPNDPIPPIAFSSEMAVALILGTRPTTGYHARVARVAQRGDTWIVSAVEVVPCVGATIITYPLSAFAIPRTDRHVAVEWTREGPNCQ